MQNATEFEEDFYNLKFGTASKSVITLVVVMVYKEDAFVNWSGDTMVQDDWQVDDHETRQRLIIVIS